MVSYVVNLKNDTRKRSDFIANNYEILKANYTFIDAIDGRVLDLERLGYNKNKAFQLLNREMSAGEIGCYLSHMHIYQQIIDNKIPYAVVFEDDVRIIDTNFLQLLEQLSSKQYYDIFLLARHYKKRDKIDDMFHEHLNDKYDILQVSKRAWGAYGYVVTNEACQKLLKYKNDIFLPIDTLGREKHFDKFLDVYCIYPNIIEVDTDNSGLELERRKKRDENRMINRSKNKFKILINQIFKGKDDTH